MCPVLSQGLQGLPVAIAATCLLTLITAQAFKRLYNHPMSKYPGPSLASLTLWYKAYYEIIRDGGWSERIGQLHNQYGMLLIILRYSSAQC